LHWQRFKQESQTLQITYDHPQLLRSKIDLNTNFNFLKEDSTFTSRAFNIDFNFQVSLNQTVGTGVEIRSSNSLNFSPEMNDVLPEINSTRSYMGKFGYAIKAAKQAPIENHTTSFQLSLGAGSRTIQAESGIEDFVYDSIDSKTPIFQLKSVLVLERPLYDRLSISNTASYQLIQSNNLFRNEAIRLGGFNSLRGFNENFFFLRQYVLNQLELRYYYSKQGYVFAFFDQAFAERYGESRFS
jgi:hemolysin activation/secretion protein